MNIKFCGAAGEVTGSCHLITINGKKVALDAGMFQGHRKDADMKNRNPLFDPKELDAVVLSHAHLDHCGLLPLFYKRGFRGKIFATPATVDLAHFILKDSAFIQEHNALQWNKRHAKQPISPMYKMVDADSVFGLFEGRRLDEKFEVVSGMKVTFREAGHILGAAQMEIELQEKGEKVKLLFTGDMGRKHLPIINDPETVESADVLITESTYGNREHDTFKIARSEFVQVINETIAQGGKVIIPSFAMERTQEILHLLHQTFDSGEITPVPVYVDSPLATNVTGVFERHAHLYDDETKQVFGDSNPFHFAQLKFTRTADESKKITAEHKPMIILSASGMCEAGRILHHLEATVEDPKNTILVVGFMAEGTLGRALADKKEVVKIFGYEYQRKARVKIFNNFSAHADHNELVEQLKKTHGIKRAFVVHGEAESAKAMKQHFKENMSIPEIIIPQRGDEYKLNIS